MAIRPIFLTTCYNNKPVIVENIQFEWIKGLAFSQKQKRVLNFHKAIKEKYPNKRILEISTKSDNSLGIELSAFNLKLIYNDINTSIESAYQSSKIFEDNVKYENLLLKDSIKSKKYYKLNTSGKIKGFKFQEIFFESEPKTMFYDWLYITALMQHDELVQEIINYNLFTDIEYNPNKSVNCQAHAAALFVSLFKTGKLNDIINNIESFKLYYKSIFIKDEDEQMNMF